MTTYLTHSKFLASMDSDDKTRNGLEMAMICSGFPIALEGMILVAWKIKKASADRPRETIK